LRLVAATIAGASLAFVAGDARSADAIADAGAPAARASGLAVLALAGANAPAWGLAQAVYASDALRPQGLDEAHARVLAGDAPPPNAPKELADLAETRAAVRGDDAPSRAILASLANTFHLRGIVVVEMDGAAHPSAHVFLAETGSFDAARYAPDATGAGAAAASAADAGSAPPFAWAGATASLARAFANAPAATAGAPAAGAPIGGGPASTEPTHAASAPALATSPLPPAHVAPGERGGEEKSGPTPFYKSPWFWGALGAAAFGGATLYFATRDNSSGTIHLQMQAPR